MLLHLVLNEVKVLCLLNCNFLPLALVYNAVTNHCVRRLSFAWLNQDSWHTLVCALMV